MQQYRKRKQGRFLGYFWRKYVRKNRWMSDFGPDSKPKSYSILIGRLKIVFSKPMSFEVLLFMNLHVRYEDVRGYI